MEPLASMLAASLLRAWGLSFATTNLSLDNFAFLLGDPKALGALGNSFRLALFTDEEIGRASCRERV